MAKKQITIPIFIPHMGCPHCCVFCNQWKISSAEKKPNPDKIKNTIELYLSRISFSVEKVELAFFGGSFTAIPFEEQEFFLSAVKPYMDKGVINSIRLSTRPDYIDRKRLDLLAAYGVSTVELGVQSFSNEVLKLSERGHGAEDVYKAIELLKLYGFRTGIQLMPGLPGDSFSASIDSASSASALAPDDVRIYPAVVLKGTGLARMYREGKFSPLTVDEAVEVSAAMYKIFMEKEINVIRIGLHPLDFHEETVIAGPYHPALGFLVKSRYKRDILEAAIKKSTIKENRNPLILVVPSLCAEEYIGMKKCNIGYIRNLYKNRKVEYVIRDVKSPYIEE